MGALNDFRSLPHLESLAAAQMARTEDFRSPFLKFKFPCYSDFGSLHPFE